MAKKKKTPKKTKAKAKAKTAKTKKAAAAANVPEPVKSDAPEMATIPPVIFLLYLMGGITLDWVIPVDMGHGWGLLGLILLVLSLLMIQRCRTLFEEAGTNTNPSKPTTTIIQTGPYSMSRNPIYVCFLIAYAGLALLIDAPLMLLLLYPLYRTLDQKVIVPEETYLEEKFGEDYLTYKAKVKRWI